ncbi:glycosyltransferase, partial [Heyndrickxia coagulans]|uniref:glycosyltransferase n=1 Tax=Heyndrickxia coagulans TaxID=1398 RepID=UPI002E03DB92|nr:glycosyltransferase [Heyndrickxia coagulans]
ISSRIQVEDTKECIDSILTNVTYDNYEIVLVDNGSTNSSKKDLLKLYEEKQNIHFIDSRKNLGFAKGNNIGYIFAKTKLNADFIVLINNDTLIKQSMFIQEILKKYNETKFHILGPDIISTKDGMHQNPQLLTGLSEKDIKMAIFILRIKLILNYIGADNFLTYLIKLVRKIINIKKENINIGLNNYWEREQRNIQLHGACLIFSPLYVTKYNGLYDRTFMYVEEDILHYIAQKENMITIYSPKIHLYHKEESTSNILFSSRRKRAFKYKHSIKSFKELLKIRKNNAIYKRNLMNRYIEF